MSSGLDISPDISALYSEYQDRLDDFWGRRQNRPRFVRERTFFGRRVRFSSNQQRVLRAAETCQPLYSMAPATDEPPLAVQFVVRAGSGDAGPPPDNLFDHIRYTGEAEWLLLRLGEWGECFVDLAAGVARAVLAPRLADRPDLVSRCLLNTVLTNFFIARGFGMLHASCLVRDERALLLVAPHNSGKSTTALRLALAGYRLLSDSMIFLPPDQEPPHLMGFPVGKVKLRQDMLHAFPQLRPLLTPEPVRDEIKYSLDLREVDADLVCETAFAPAAVDLCLLSPGRSTRTTLQPADRAAMLPALMVNSLFYDTPQVWQRNLAAIGSLVRRARCHHLTIGRDEEGILSTVTKLFQSDPP